MYYILGENDNDIDIKHLSQTFDKLGGMADWPIIFNINSFLCLKMSVTFILILTENLNNELLKLLKGNQRQYLCFLLLFVLVYLFPDKFYHYLIFVILLLSCFINKGKIKPWFFIDCTLSFHVRVSE